MPLRLYNTLTRKKEIFKPIKKTEVGLYSCGPTVYWYQHIGNLRTFIFNDFLKKVLEYNNYQVRHVINITDVGHLTQDDVDQGEDKIEKAAKKEGKSAKEIADYYLKVFQEDLKKLNIKPPNFWPKATEHIKEQIAIIKNLEKKGYTYKTSDGIYFNTSVFTSYGELANLKKQNLQHGKRISLKEKQNPTDFALWKFSYPNDKRQQEWDSPWGKGFPGWHIECSAMSMKYLGEHFDIHTGGQEHIQVHHSNEIAQSEAATTKKFVNYWMHAAWLLNEQGEKVSKSKGGLYTLSELIDKDYEPMHFRYLCLLTHYKKPLRFTLNNLDTAKTTFEKLKKKIIELKDKKHKANNLTKDYEKKFLEALNDDLNIPLAIQVFHKALDDFDFDPKHKLKLLEKFDKVLSLNIKEFEITVITIPKEVEKLIKAREQARQLRHWEKADILRQRIKEKGYEIEDTDKGTKVTI